MVNSLQFRYIADAVYHGEKKEMTLFFCSLVSNYKERAGQTNESISDS